MNQNDIEAALIGRLGSDPERRTAQSSGKHYVRFSVAVGEGDATQWVQVSAFNTTAITVLGTLKKGDRAYVEGRIRMDQWTDKAGQQRHGLSVAASRVHAVGQIGERRTKEGRQQPAETAQATSTPRQPERDWQRPVGSPAAHTRSAEDVEIPF